MRVGAGSAKQSGRETRRWREKKDTKAEGKKMREENGELEKRGIKKDVPCPHP